MAVLEESKVEVHHYMLASCLSYDCHAITLWRPDGFYMIVVWQISKMEPDFKLQVYYRKAFEYRLAHSLIFSRVDPPTHPPTPPASQPANHSSN